MCEIKCMWFVGGRWSVFAVVLALVLTACLSLSAGDGLGASLRLEGRMALRRGLQALLAGQGEDGSWEGDAAATGQAVMAIMMSGLASEWPELQTARQRGKTWLETWLRAGQQQPSGGWATGALVAVRPLLRQSDPDSQDWSGLVDTALRQIFPGHVAESDLPWILEAAALTGQPLPEADSRQRFGEASNRQGGGSPACRLAAALLAGRPESEQAPLRAVAWESDWGRERPVGWYWLARVGRVRGHSASVGQGTWRERLMAIVLSRQRGDGGWGEAEDSPGRRILNSALAVQTMILCLA